MDIPFRRKKTPPTTQRHLSNNVEQIIQQPVTNDLRDSVLTSLSYQDISTVGGITSLLPQETHEPPRDFDSNSDIQNSAIDCLPLRQLHEILFPVDLPNRIQDFLDQFRDKLPATVGEYKQITGLLNQIVNGAKLTLSFPPSGDPVRLRVISPMRSDKAYFQLRTANAKQQALYTGLRFPNLSVS